MKKISMVCLCILFVSTVIAGCGCFDSSQKVKIKESLTAEEMGSMGTETRNFGTISEYNGEIYYVHEEYLYKRKADWTGKTQISQNKVASLMILDGWIYYQGNADGGTLYRMKTDGTQMTIVSTDNVGEYVPAGEWIFYNLAKTSDVKMGMDSLYKIKIDGTQKSKLLDLKWSDNLKIQGDWLYYENIAESSKGMASTIYRIKTDGTGNVRITKDDGNYHSCYFADDWMYYLKNVEEGKGLETITIYRAKADGTGNAEVLSLRGVANLVFAGEWAYYTTNKEMLRVKLDGTGKETLNTVNIWQLNAVSGNWMYTSEYVGAQYRIKLDGSIGLQLN